MVDFAKFGRTARLTVDDKEIIYPDLEMNFEVSFDTGSDGNVGNIEVYNLSDETIKLLKKGQSFVFKAGYKNDLGILTMGQIESSTTKFEQGDKLTKIVINDNTQKWVNTKINKTWRLKIKASQVAEQIINKIPLNIGEISVAEEKTYHKGKTFSTTAKRALEEIAKDTKSKLHISKGKVYLRPSDKPSQIAYKLTPDTGLIASPQRVDNNDKRWKVQSLLNYKFESDAILSIESDTIEGKYRITEGKHTGDWITEMEVKPYSA
ncbi:phage protein [Sporohalobacter salinus]|uniref:phage protein n=1 Tax=Sporohalobacter salinus TaxID=1494606 RepID=UPI00196187E8|nr:hypothetical protein [Sporohalobacter salinus]MBM7623642.1 nitrogen fixation protein FixH [Sporohalobacter salinus]